MNQKYVLPALPYGYGDLEPYISEEQLKIHYEKHHMAYVTNSNALLDRLEKSREKREDIDMTAVGKALSFNVGGHLLHSLFWPNLSPKGGGEPNGAIKKEIEAEFGSFDRFKKEFSSTAMAEGSGWSALTYCTKTKRLILMQIEKHNVNVIPSFSIILLLDMWEHAFYLDYKNDRPRFIDAFWKLVNWDEVNRRLHAVSSS